MKKGAGPLREVFFEKTKKTGSLETPGISIYLIHCILLRLMYRYPYPFFLPWEGIKHQHRIVSTEPPTVPATGTDHRTSGSTRAEPSKARGGWYLWWVISGPHTLAIRQQLVTSIVADPLHVKLFRKTVAVQVAESDMSLPIPSPKRLDQWWFDDPQRPISSYRPGTQSQVSAWLHRHGQQMWIRII